MPPSVGIIFKHGYSPAMEETLRLERWLVDRGVEVYTEEMKPLAVPFGELEERTSIPPTVDGVVVLGGDGTLLAAARRVGPFDKPILGVNLGGLGFLTAVPLSEVTPVMEEMLAGRLVEERRGMLACRIVRETGESLGCRVLNDVVVNKRTLARVIDLRVQVDGELLTVFRADGLIIATPTGSTAYTLSAGGPILHPTTEALILTPICPFTLSNRPIILPDSATLEILTDKASEGSVVVTFDGQIGTEFRSGDRLLIQEAKEKLRLLRPPGHSYYRLLRTKLMWGGVTGGKDGVHEMDPASGA